MRIISHIFLTAFVSLNTLAFSAPLEYSTFTSDPVPKDLPASTRDYFAQIYQEGQPRSQQVEENETTQNEYIKPTGAPMRSHLVVSAH